jgi:Domain of unknown function (DUF397)
MASQPAWRVATYTGGNGNCVEVADAASVVMVRDTKDRDAGTISFPVGAWEVFTSKIKNALQGDP